MELEKSFELISLNGSRLKIMNQFAAIDFSIELYARSTCIFEHDWSTDIKILVWTNELDELNESLIQVDGKIVLTNTH